MQLALLAHRRGPPTPIEDVHSDVGQGATERERAGLRDRQLGPDLVRQHADGGLGWAVVIVDLTARCQRPQAGDPVQPRGFAAQDEASPGHDGFWMGARLQGREMRRHDLQDVDALTLEVFREQRLVLGPLLRHDVQAAAGGERREHHRVAEIGRDGRHGRVIHARLESQALGDAQDVVDDVAMGDADALGAARGAACIDHIREVVRPDRGRSRRGRVPVGPVEGVQAHGSRPVDRQARHEVGVREHHRGVGIGQHEADPLLRVSRVEGQVPGPGLEDAENAHHHLDRALHEQADQHVRADASTSQVVREPFGAAVQFAIRYPLLLEHHRHPIGRAARLRLDQLMQAEILQSEHAISSFMISLAPA